MSYRIVTVRDGSYKWMRRMREIDAHNAADYLRGSGHLAAGERCEIRELAGGVSNLVLRVSFPGGELPDFVLKQARPQLRTADPWYCTVERIWREVEVLRVCGELLANSSAASFSRDAKRSVRPVELATRAPPSTADKTTHAGTPSVLFEDRENFLFAMSAAPAEHTVWKADLLSGKVDANCAEQSGLLLATLHAGSWGRADLAARLADRQVYRELRLDPYYRHVARVQPSAAAWFEQLIADNEATQLAMVHADFSPKNLLVHAGGMTLVDFETGHYGDPAFDLGFFLSHLLLKAVYHAPNHAPYLDLTRRFWTCYQAVLRPAIGEVAYDALLARGILNLAGCAWARIDGTSKVDYLTDLSRQETTRSICRRLFQEAPRTWDDVLGIASQQLAGWRHT